MFAHQDVLVDFPVFMKLFLSLLGHSVSPLYSTLNNIARSQSDTLFYLSVPRFANGLQARLLQPLLLPPPPFHVHLHLPHLVTGCVLTQAEDRLYSTCMAKTCPPLPPRVLEAVLSQSKQPP